MIWRTQQPHSHRSRKGPRSPAGVHGPNLEYSDLFQPLYFQLFYCTVLLSSRLRGRITHYTRPHGRTVLERNAEKIKYFDAVPCPLSINNWRFGVTRVQASVPYVIILNCSWLKLGKVSQFDHITSQQTCKEFDKEFQLLVDQSVVYCGGRTSRFLSAEVLRNLQLTQWKFESALRPNSGRN